MNKLVMLDLYVCLILFMSSCALFKTSMTPMEVTNTLPTLTNSKFMTHEQAEKVINNKSGKYLVKGRNYVAPDGIGVKGDLRNAAEGIDEWVKIDGGNAYELVNYKWVVTDQDGSTQLHIKFNTILSKER